MAALLPGSSDDASKVDIESCLKLNIDAQVGLVWLPASHGQCHSNLVYSINHCVSNVMCNGQYATICSI